MSLASVLLVAQAAAAPCTSGCSAGWEFAGPATYVDRGDDLKISNAGAINNVVNSHWDKKNWFVGSVNGGVWRSTTLQDKVPHWENVLDGQPVTCSSISALYVSNFDASTVYAGCGGSTSSEQGLDWNVMNSGDWSGMMVSTDHGDTWAMTSFPPNYYITSIVEPTKGNLLVSTQSHLYNASDGGIWLSADGKASTWTKTSSKQTFSLLRTAVTGCGSNIIASHAHADPSTSSVSVSYDGGYSWGDFGSPALKWQPGTVPFYTALTMLSDGSTLVLGGLNVLTSNASVTNSAIFTTSLKEACAARTAAAAGTVGTAVDVAWKLLPQPTSMDEDSMPKDRMAVLGDPLHPDIMYVAGNAGALAWRVNITTGDWSKLWDAPEIADGSEPHGDCRNYAWDSSLGSAGGRLVLVSDGGIFARVQPRKGGGSAEWLSLNGDIQEMEYLSAHYDNRADRFVAGAQDNAAQVFPQNSKPTDVATGFVDGDGTVTLVDNVHNPARLFGTTQFLGVGSIDIDPSRRRQRREQRQQQRRARRGGEHEHDGDHDGDDDDDDEDCGGLCFAQADNKTGVDKFIAVPLDTYFPDPASFPYFVQPMALNSQDPTQLVFWANGTSADKPSAFYKFDIPADVDDSKDIKAPTMVTKTPADAFFLDFVSGGYTKGAADPTLLVGMSNANLYVQNAGTGGKMVTRPLPVEFAMPVTLGYAAGTGARILGPVSHGSTISLAVSPSDSNTVAVTGWPSITTNVGLEQVFLTRDGGVTWQNMTEGLREATGVVGKVRAGGLLLVDLLANQQHALLASTSNGVMVTYVGAAGRRTDANPAAASTWTRFGTCAEFPIVLNAALSYEHYSDTLVAATFGRGVYRLKNAKQSLLNLRQCSSQSTTPLVPEESSAKFFPRQQ